MTNQNNQPELIPTTCLCDECLFHIKRKNDDHQYCKYNLYPYRKDNIEATLSYHRCTECPLYINRNKEAHDDRSSRRLRSYTTKLLDRIKKHPDDFAIQFLGFEDFPKEPPKSLNLIERYFYKRIQKKNPRPKK